ncbi:MBL fold metallo-hydrolase [Hoeflea sp.]|uniref:MBL fold metallo-hydrolase n=1 Tax=Hoeflea sp. TaxID=1940281 RepID=UPI003B51F15B
MTAIQSRLSRRSLFKATALGAGALAAPQILVRAAQAEVPMAAAQPAAYKRFTLGDFEITVLSDGHRIVENPHGIFGMNTSQSDVESLLTESYLPVDKMQFTFAPTLVNTGEDLVLFDAGNGEGGREGGVGQTLANLKASGYTPDQVTVVVLTHLHGDHIGGLMEAGAPAFPNARYVTAQGEYDFWSSEDRMGTPAENGHKNVVAKVVPLAEKMSFVGDGDSVVPGITGMAAFGHTPGHMIYGLESGGRTLMLTADTANHFVLSLQRPDWEVLFDMDKAAAAATRKSVFDMIASDRLAFVGYHMPFPSVGYVEKMGEGYRFIPETYQLDL